jgi:glycine C-acetyltransferase
MHESFVKRIAGQLDEIRSAGLFKIERVISSEQGVEQKAVTVEFLRE